jgi:hypothetical protein
MSLRTCPRCDGFVPARAARCPHCPGGGLLRVLAGTFAMTLMACYGVSPRYMHAQGPNDCVDGDGDGVCAPTDCNDADKTVFPNAADSDGDGVDSNCDGVDGWRDPDVVATPVDGGATQP